MWTDGSSSAGRVALFGIVVRLNGRARGHSAELAISDVISNQFDDMRRGRYVSCSISCATLERCLHEGCQQELPVSQVIAGQVGSGADRDGVLITAASEPNKSYFNLLARCMRLPVCRAIGMMNSFQERDRIMLRKTVLGMVAVASMLVLSAGVASANYGHGHGHGHGYGNHGYGYRGGYGGGYGYRPPVVVAPAPIYGYPAVGGYGYGGCGPQAGYGYGGYGYGRPGVGVGVTTPGFGFYVR